MNVWKFVPCSDSSVFYHNSKGLCSKCLKLKVKTQCACFFCCCLPLRPTIIILKNALRQGCSLQYSVYSNPLSCPVTSPSCPASLPSDAHRPGLPLFKLVRPRPTSVRLSACHPGVMPLSQPLRGPFDSEAARVCPIIWEPDTGMNC